MYEEIFNFQSRPFTSTPFTDHYFAAGPMQEALDLACRAIDRDSGPSIATGAPGTGKSLFLAMLANKYQDKLTVANLSCSGLEERRDLLQSILYELNQPYRDMSEGELRLSLIDFIKPGAQCPDGVLLLIDDAQSLSVELIDELRLVTNFVRDGVPRVRLVMAGTPRLEEVLTDPKLESFNQRIAVRCYLGNLSRDETRSYIAEHITRAGGDANAMFDDATCVAIHEATNGCPRFVNQLCEQCMITAATNGFLVVEARFVEQSWAEVQGLPVNKESFASEPASINEDTNWTVLEFGQLDDEPASPASEPEAQPDVVVEDAVEELIVEEVGAEAAFPAEIQSLYAEQESVWEQAGAVQTSPEPEVKETAAAEIADAFHDEPVAFPNSVDAVETACELASEVAEPSFVEEAPAEPVAEQNTPSVADPFAESFESEEQVDDPFAGLVAAQNLSSLEVTAGELGLLQPLDQPAAAAPSSEQVTAFASEAKLVAEPEFENQVEPQLDVERPSSPTVEVVGESVAAESEQEQLAAPLAEDVTELRNEGAPNVEETPTATPELEPYPPMSPLAGTGYHNHEYEPTAEVQRQAEEILGKINLENEAAQVSHETSTSFAPQVPDEPEPASNSMVVEASDAVPAANEELSEVQQILNEILEQNSVLKNQTQPELGDPEPEPESYSMVNSIAPVAEHKAQDDRDMIVVNEMAESAPAQNQQAAFSPAEQTPVSTGRAERMDYEKLFEQLRTVDSEPNANG